VFAGIYGGQSGTAADLTANTPALPCQYHSTNAPYSSSTRCSCQDNRAKRWNLPNSNALLANGENWIEKYFHLVF